MYSLKVNGYHLKKKKKAHLRRNLHNEATIKTPKQQSSGNFQVGEHSHSWGVQRAPTPQSQSFPRGTLLGLLVQLAAHFCHKWTEKQGVRERHPNTTVSDTRTLVLPLLVSWRAWALGLVLWLAFPCLHKIECRLNSLRV